MRRALGSRGGNPDPEPLEDLLEDLEAFKNQHSRTNGLHNNNMDDASRIGIGIHEKVYLSISLDSEAGLSYDVALLFARLAQQVLEGVFRFRKGTMVLDPIAYVKNKVGVFVKSGSAVDAAKYASILRDR